MPVAQARALFDARGVRIEAHEPNRDRAALRSLAVWAQRLSPVVAVDDALDEPDMLLLDVTGCARVFRGEDQLVRLAVDGLARLGIHARAVIAPTYGCAWAGARFGPDPQSVIAPGGAREAIAPLPVGALRIDDAVVAELMTLGIERVEHLLELPRAALPARFGRGLLLQIDRALGQAIETIDPVRVAPPLAVERVFDGPTDRTEVIELTVRDLLVAVTDELRRRESGARSIEVELVRSDLPPERLVIVLGRPSRDAKHLWSLLWPRLERAHLGFGVQGVRIRAGLIGRLRHEQGEQWGDRRSLSAVEMGRACDELLDTLRNRLGGDRVLRASLVESHLPERAFEMRPDAAGRGVDAGITAHDRPTVLLDPAQATGIVLLTPDGSVRRVRWQGVDHAVVACVGPERIASAWWRRAKGTRDYFAVQCQTGRWLWVSRVIETGRWCVHGVWA